MTEIFLTSQSTKFFVQRIKSCIVVLSFFVILTQVATSQPMVELLGPNETNLNPNSVELETEVNNTNSQSMGYWRNIEITETSGGTYQDYVTVIAIEHNENIKDNFSDIEFYESDKSTKIEFGLLNKINSNQANFTLRRDYQSGQTQDIYVKYGDGTNTSNWVDQSEWQGWVNNWYENHSWGESPSSYTSTCDKSAHSISGNIPSWADIAFFSDYFNDTGGLQAYGGLAEINGNEVAWADGNSENTCSKGVSSRRRDRYNYQRIHEASENSGAWNFGGSNTVDYGHFAGGNAGIHVSWFPKRPDINVKSETTISQNMNISFYDDSDQSLIDRKENVSGGIYRTTWTGLSEDQTYNWYANVTDGSSTNQSNTASFTTISITLNWNDQSNNEDGFNIYSNASGDMQQVAEVGADTESATVYNNGLEFNKNTTYEIAAYNQYGESSRVKGYVVP